MIPRGLITVSIPFVQESSKTLAPPLITKTVFCPLVASPLITGSLLGGSVRSREHELVFTDAQDSNLNVVDVLLFVKYVMDGAPKIRFELGGQTMTFFNELIHRGRLEVPVRLLIIKFPSVDDAEVLETLKFPFVEKDEATTNGSVTFDNDPACMTPLTYNVETVELGKEFPPR